MKTIYTFFALSITLLVIFSLTAQTTVHAVNLKPTGKKVEVLIDDKAANEVKLDENGEISNLPLGITYNTSLQEIIEIQFLLQMNENQNYIVTFDTSDSQVIQVRIEEPRNHLVHELIYNNESNSLRKIIITKAA